MAWELLILAAFGVLLMAVFAAAFAFVFLRGGDFAAESDQFRIFSPNPPVPRMELPAFEISTVRLKRPRVVSPLPQTEPPREAVERALRVRELASATQSSEKSADSTQTGLTDRVSPPPPLEVTHPDTEERTRRIRAFALKHARA
ncbi:MAG: hypothetical protein IPK87_07715 [Planctomycetes bacterium]|nr:hypothetical protein [Planctomycetota bacterium]